MQALCEKCRLPHPPLIACTEAQSAAMIQLLLHVGQVDTCCGQTIYWVRHLSGRKAPYTQAGLIHFANCTGKYKKEGS